jgi:hypothetical protein
VKNLYILYYRPKDTNAHFIKYFEHEGSLEKAINRGRTHCDIMGYRFIFVRPFLSDITGEERLKRRAFRIEDRPESRELEAGGVG